MNKVVFIILLICFASCTEDIHIELDGHDPKVVVNCFFSKEDSLKVHLSKSSLILDDDSLNYIDNAVIEIFQDGSNIGTLNHNEKGIYSQAANLTPEANYTITVSVTGMETIVAQDTIPIHAPINKFDTTSIDDKYLYCEIEFQDNIEIDNFYLLEVSAKFPVINSNSKESDLVDIVVIDNIIENGGNGDIRKRVYFSDKKIAGEDYYLSFVLDKEVLSSSTHSEQNVIYINFKTISRNYYSYIKTYYESKTRQMDIFTNIEEGYGIFAGYGLSQDSIVVQGKKEK